ncbi:MAG: sigma-70 family RNA polymerase sigma factor [Planctomycetia bacterium]
MAFQEEPAKKKDENVWDWSHHASPTGTISTSILEGARNKNQDDWEQLVKLYAPLVYKMARQSGLQSSDAAEVVSDVFKKIQENLSKFKREEDSDTFTGWVRIITRNCIKDFFRRQGKIPQAFGGDNPGGVIENLSDEEERSECGEWDKEVAFRAMQIVMADSEDKTVKVFKELIFEERPAREVAERHGMKTSAVYQAKARVLKRIREELKGLIDMGNAPELGGDDPGDPPKNPPENS